MATYERADKSVQNEVHRVMAKYHGPKAESGVRVQVLMASAARDANGDPTGPAIRVNGYPAVACIRILSLKDRVARGFDAEMQLDADAWQEKSEAEQEAVIDHELTHLELVTKEGAVQRDDADRPRLRIRKHDRFCGFFDVVAARHGEASVEIQTVREWLADESYTQCYLPGMEPVAS